MEAVNRARAAQRQPLLSLRRGEQERERVIGETQVMSVPQHSATHCNTLQHTATHCSTLQRTAAHCNTLQHTATPGDI